MMCGVTMFYIFSMTILCIYGHVLCQGVYFLCSMTMAHVEACMMYGMTIEHV